MIEFSITLKVRPVESSAQEVIDAMAEYLCDSLYVGVDPDANDAFVVDDLTIHKAVLA